MVFEMKAHIDVGIDSGLIHTLTGTAANAHDVTQAHELLHGEETDVFANPDYRGVHKREEVKARHPNVGWHVAMIPGRGRGRRRTPDAGQEPEARQAAR